MSKGKRYTQEFKTEAVKQITEGGYSVADVSFGLISFGGISFGLFAIGIQTFGDTQINLIEFLTFQ